MDRVRSWTQVGSATQVTTVRSAPVLAPMPTWQPPPPPPSLLEPVRPPEPRPLWAPQPSLAPVVAERPARRWSLSDLALRAVGLVVIGAIYWGFEANREAEKRVDYDRMMRSGLNLSVTPRATSALSAVNPAPVPKPMPRPASVPLPPPRPEPRPDHVPSPVLSRMQYRGVEILDYGESVARRYVAPSLGMRSSALQPLRLEVNARSFRNTTGIDSPDLEALYAGADANRNGELSWTEIETFQASLDARYRYQANETALRPDEFLEQGGGDCEDWALVSCGLMRYWGMTSYVGSFAESASAVGHALCLVRAGAIPDRYGWIDIQPGAAADGSAVEPGRYVVVDYEHVGRTSNAVEPSWSVQRLYVPEWAYGEAM